MGVAVGVNEASPNNKNPMLWIWGNIELARAGASEAQSGERTRAHEESGGERARKRTGGGIVRDGTATTD